MLRTAVPIAATCVFLFACKEKPPECAQFATENNAELISSSQQLDGRRGVGEGQNASLPGLYVLAAKLDLHGKHLTFAGEEDPALYAWHFKNPFDDERTGAIDRFRALRGKSGCFLARIEFRNLGEFALTVSLTARILDAGPGVE